MFDCHLDLFGPVCPFSPSYVSQPLPSSHLRFYARLLRMQQNLPLDTNFTHLNIDSGQNGRDEILRGLMKVRGIVWMLKVG